MRKLKKLQKDGTPERQVKEADKKLQQLTDAFVVKCDKHSESKKGNFNSLIMRYTVIS